MNEVLVLGRQLQRCNVINSRSFTPSLRVKRLIKSMQLFKSEQKGNNRYPIRAGYVAKRLATTQKQFNQNLLEAYPDNLLHFVSEDFVVIKRERKPGQGLLEYSLGVNSEDAKNIPTITAITKRFNKFLGILKQTYIKHL